MATLCGSSNTEHPDSRQLSIAVSTFKYKLKNFLLYAGVFLMACHGTQAAEGKEGFRAKHFLEMKDEQKKLWLHGAMNAFAHMAASKDHAAGKCVHDWYFSEDINYKDGVILATMRKYPEVTPTAVLLALTEKSCGIYKG